MNIKNIFEVIKSLKQPDTYKLLKKTDILFFCHDLDRGENLNGYPYSKLIDSLVEDFQSRGWDCAQFSHSYSILNGKLSWGNPVSGNRALLLCAIKSRLLKIIKKVSSLVLFEFNYVEPQLNFYSNLFKLTNPKCIITIGSPPLMCVAAKDNNIKLYEILHGIGYKPIPWGWATENIRRIPDGIISIDDLSTKTFSPLREKGVDIRQIPNPFLKRFSNEISLKKLPKEWIAPPDWIPKSTKKIILITFQWGYDGDHGSYTHFSGLLENGLMPKALLDVVEKTKDEVFWLLRLHPQQLRMPVYSRHREFLINITSKFSNTEWIQSSTLPLPLLLKSCDGHITMSSMTSYEAAYFGVRTLFMCPTLKKNGHNSQMFRDLLESDFAKIIEWDSEKIREWVKEAKKSKNKFNLNSSTENDWESTIKQLLGTLYKNCRT